MPSLIETGSYELDRLGNILFVDQEGVDWLGRGDLIGKNLWAEFPDQVQTDVYRAIQKVAMGKRQRIRIEFESPLTASRIAVIAIPTANGCVVDFSRIPDGMRGDRNGLEWCRSYLLKLSDALRSISDPGEIQKTACRILGEQLEVSHVMYGDVMDEKLLVLSHFYMEDMPLFTTVMTSYEFGETMIAAYRRNEAVIFADVRSDPRYSPKDRETLISLNAIAGVSVGLLKAGRWQAVFGMYHHEPRHWTPIEISMLEETAQRTWEAVERARTEQAFRESEERLQLSLKCANVFAWEVNCETGETKYSDNCDEVLGFKIERISTDNFITIHPEDKPAVLEAMDKAMKGEEPADIEHRVIHPHTGEIIWIRAQGRLISRRGFEKSALIGITQNITGQKKAEEALHQSDALLSSVFSILPIGLGIMDATGKIVEHNEEMRRFLTITPDGDIKLPYDWIGVSGERVGAIEREMEYYLAGGNAIWTRVAYIPLRNKQDDITGAVIGITDIDELKRTTQALQAHERRLTELVNIRDEFIGVASHELKTPVTSLKAYAQLLDRRLTEIGDTQDSIILTRLRVQVDRLTTLINHLLDTTRISQGLLKLSPEEVDLGKLLKESVEEFRLTATNRFQMQMDAVPPVMADRERIGQVIVNLLSNAVKYSAPGSVIAITCRNTGGDIQIGVHDEGNGIPEEHQLKIFERFFRSVVVNTDTVPGMGLGLYIAAQIIERHGGRIWVESALGKGSVFFFTIPLSQPD